MHLPDPMSLLLTILLTSAPATEPLPGTIKTLSFQELEQKGQEVINRFKSQNNRDRAPAVQKAENSWTDSFQLGHQGLYLCIDF